MGTAYDEAYKYAEKATTSLREVVDGIQVIADSAKKIKEISIEQADSMEQVEATEERIAEVVQNNSAAAQETSATSEELTAQATTLSGMVSVFKLRHKNRQSFLLSARLIFTYMVIFCKIGHFLQRVLKNTFL